MAVKSRITPWKKEEDEDKKEKLPKSYGRFSGWSEEEEEEDVIFVPQEEKAKPVKEEKRKDVGKRNIFQKAGHWIADKVQGERPREGRDYVTSYEPGQYSEENRVKLHDKVASKVSDFFKRVAGNISEADNLNELTMGRESTQEYKDGRIDVRAEVPKPISIVDRLNSGELKEREVIQNAKDLYVERLLETGMNIKNLPLTDEQKEIWLNRPKPDKFDFDPFKDPPKDTMTDFEYITTVMTYRNQEDTSVEIAEIEKQLAQDPKNKDLRKRVELLQDKQEMINDVIVGMETKKITAQNIWEAFTDKDLIPIIGDLMAAKELKDISRAVKKWERGETLTTKEKNLITKAELMELEGLQERSFGYNVVSSIPGSLVLMAEFALTSLIPGPFDEAALTATKTTKLGAFAMKTANVFTAAAVRTATTGAGEVYYNYLKQTEPQYQFLLSGEEEMIKIRDGSDDNADAFFRAVGNTYGQYLIESVGGEAVTALPDLIKSKVLVEYAKKNGLKTSESFVSHWAKKGGWSSVIGEFSEEEMGRMWEEWTMQGTVSAPTTETLATELASVLILGGVIDGAGQIETIVKSSPDSNTTLADEGVQVKIPEIKLPVETEIKKEPEVAKEVKPETLYSAQKGEIVEKEQAYKKVKEVDTDQVEILREFVKEGDAVAKELLYGKGDVERTKIDYAKTDYYIQKKLSSEYEAIKYNNANMPIKGVEYHDLKENRFYATSEDAAKLYKNQTRREKYNTPEFKEFAKKVDESLAPPVVKKEKVIKPKEAETKKSNLGWVEIKNAKSLEISGFKVYSHKGEDGGYIITEATSGLAMATGKTLKEAKEKAQAAVDRYGVKVVKERIAAQVKELGSRPDEKPYMRIRTQADIDRGKKMVKDKLKKEREGEEKKASKRTYEEVVKDLQKYLKKRGISVSKNNNATIREARQELRGQLDTLLNQIKETPNQERKEMFSKQYDKLSLLEREALMLEKRFPEKFKPKTQKERVKETLEGEAPKTIKEIAKETKILEPNIRRILGVGAKEGEFERVADGVYTLTKDGKSVAYIIPGNALVELPKLAKKGFKADMVFLDIPYKTPAITGGNRGMKYEFITVQEFGKVLDSVNEILKSKDSAVVYMFSNAKSGLEKMGEYNNMLDQKGLKVIAKGQWQKRFQSGKPVTNVRGVVAQPEGILLLSKSGKLSQKYAPIDLNFDLVRPKGYQSEKNAEMIAQMIRMTTKEGDVVLDPFAGSGVVPAEAVKAKRVAVGIEIEKEVVEKTILPRVEDAAKYEELKKKMKKRLTPEEAAEAQRLIDEEVKGIPGASVEMADSEASQFFGKLKELRNSTSLETKIEAAEEAIKEFSPALARDHEFTPEEVQARAKRIQSMSAIDLTDIVSLVNNLSEKELLTIVKKFRSPGVRGMFRPARGGAVSIDILASLFYDPAIAAKTVAHEIGHFVDFLPDNRMAGTFASKIAGVKSKAKNFGEFKDAVMREEIYTLSKDVWRPYNEGTATEGYIQYRKSGEELYADFISMVFMDPNLLKKEAPVTIEAWIAFLDNKPDAKAEFEEAWDLMLESGDALYDKRLKSIREMFKTGDKILWGAGETEELSKRNKLSYKLMDAWQNVKLLGSQTKRMVVDVKTPLIEIEAKAQKRLGRKLTTEEKISKQVESLQKIQAQEQTYVDTYYDPIYQRLKAEGLEWEDLGTYQFLNRIVKERGDITPQEALESLEGISVMDLFSEQDKKNPLINRVLTNLERKETDTLLTDLIEDSVGSGETISVVIEKLRKGVFETLFGTIEPKTKSGAYFAQKLRSGMLAERLSLYLPMKAGIANPLGFTTQTSLDQLAHMEKKLGTKKYNLLKDIAEKDFRAGSLALLKLKSAQHYFGARKIEKIIQNEAYVTFAVNHYLSKYIPAQIRQQSGTLKGVANVADATILKNTSMLRAMEHNEMRRNAVNFILTNDPTQIQAAPTKFDSSLGVRVLDLVKANKMKDWSVLHYMENGNLRQVMVTNEVYNAINERILENNFVGIKMLELLNNKYYRPLFVGYNLAFNVYNVQRDFLRFWKNASWLTFPEAIYYYAKAVPSVAKSVFNKQDSEVIKEMKEKRMLGFYRNDVYDNPESEVSNGVFKLYETEAGQEKAKGVKEKTQKLLETISNISQTIEMIPKVAGKMSIDKKQVFKTDAEARDMIVNYLGSPNFQNKGELYKYYNNIFLFSNAVKEGWRGDINVLAGNTPTGRKGSFVAMLRMVETTAVPVMLGFLIRHGLPPFDDDDRWGDLRELLEKIPKRDFVSFIPIPVGELGGKTVYIPVARAETDQLLAQIIWSLMDGLTDQPGGSPGEEIIDAFASEFPSINPLFTAAGAIITTASGGNPYDSFRGRNVFSPFTFDYMSGQEKAEILVEYLAGVSGLNVFIRTYDPRTYGEDSSPLQKAHQLPIIGNVIYRLLRESNYGTVETEWDTQREQKIQSRQEKQSTKKMMNEDAKQFISQGASSKEVEAKIKEYQELAVGFKEPKKGYSGSDLTTANNVRKMFKEELLKESGVLPSWRILDMTKNSQKEAELARQQERMSQTEFINYLRNLRMAEAISDTFVESLYKNGYISKDNYKKVVSGDRKKIYIYQ